ncbi:MAG: hypothetical protein AAGF85_09860 [Bacteroidota bacterium]
MKRHQIIEIALIIMAALYNLGVLILSLLWIFTNSFSGIKSNLKQLEMFDVNENVTYGLFLAGALGGAFYCLRALYQRIGETYTPIDGVEVSGSGMNMKAWIFWYVYRPIQGGVLALILLALTKSSLMEVNAGDGINMDSYYTLIGIGFLAGFGAHELIHKIQELIQVLFAKSKIKPSDSKQKVKENKGE